MSNFPDVVGYKLNEALLLLNNDYEGNVIITETLGKEKIAKGEARVLQQKEIEKDQIELVISYF